jgi:hypothetical protein
MFLDKTSYNTYIYMYKCIYIGINESEQIRGDAFDNAVHSI